MFSNSSKEQQLNISTWVVLSFVLGGLSDIFGLIWLAVPALLSGIWALILGLYYAIKIKTAGEAFTWRMVLSVIAAAFFSLFAYDLLTGHIF